MKHCRERVFFLVAILFIQCGATLAQSYALPKDELQYVKGYFDSLFPASRYMERNGVSCKYPNWDGFPLMKYTYQVHDKDGTVKTGVVIMLNASSDQLARWVVYAVIAVKGKADKAAIASLCWRIMSESQGQFPIAGVVWEDMEGDGYQKAYCFRNGVTVFTKEIVNGTKEVLSDKQLDEALTFAVTGAGNYARIVSTTPEEYTANGGTAHVGKSSDRNNVEWIDVTRSLYQAAWNKDRNDLIVAWARAHL